MWLTVSLFMINSTVLYMYLMVWCFFSFAKVLHAARGRRGLPFLQVERAHPPETAGLLRTGGIPEATYIPFGLASCGNLSQAVMCVGSSCSSFELRI